MAHGGRWVIFELRPTVERDLQWSSGENTGFSSAISKYAIHLRIIYFCFFEFLLPASLLGFYKRESLSPFRVAVAFLAHSILVDFLPEDKVPWHYLFEDGFKFLGIASWCGCQCTAWLHRVRLAFI
jgi:hypothetical protein